MTTKKQSSARTATATTDSLSSIYEGATLCMQRLISLNLKVSEAVMRDQLACLRSVVESRDLSSCWGAQTEMTRRIVRQAVSYAVDFNEVVAENQHELAALLQSQRKHNPVGTEALSAGAPPLLMLEMVKSILDAATTSRNQMMDLARQMEGRTGRN